MTTSTLSIRLKQARLHAKLSQEELGIRIGLEPASASARMNRYELGKRVPAAELIQRVAAELGLPATFFYAEMDDEAELLERYHQLTRTEKVRVMIFLKSIR
ncbi:helix-turn-helix transcriptional regulator [Pseudomonas sp.]|uniref:helix-turn-helix domain-containing protein n=1 Tax=Pseudomonas sp. TaxID=306 RepID=UPI00248A2C7E|nr:helix-turn-helix transcriptional regulator [Pseudomonas sp.]MDI1332417.1 helix-turn-helix transcriptional regulator [Pseudomonas sp.]